MSKPDTDGDPRIVVNGVEYPIPDAFTMGERADMERITGQDYDPSKGGYLGTLALMYVCVKRVNPRVEIDDLRGLGENEVDIKGLPDLPQPLGAPAASAPTSKTDSGNGSDETPAETPAPTGTPV